MTQVLIVGAGPVGLMTALGLARENIDVCLIEAEDKIVYTPRAISYAWPIFAPLEAFGVLDDMMAAGHTVDERTWRVFKTGETIIYNHDAVRDITDRPYSLTLGQDRLAEVILKHLRRYSNVTIHWGTRFTGLTQSDREVTVLADRRGEAVEFKETADEAPCASLSASHSTDSHGHSASWPPTSISISRSTAGTRVI